MKLALTIACAAACVCAFAAPAAKPAELKSRFIDVKTVKPAADKKLTVIKAVYGADKKRMVDVTKKVQAIVAKKQDIAVNNTLGGDPAKRSEKYLEVFYSINGQVKVISAKERATIKFADLK